jgi:hypothetical protein
MKRKTTLQLHPNHSFSTLRRIPPLPGEPEFIVFQGSHSAEAIAIFYSEMDAIAYSRWRTSQPSPRSLRAP